MNKHLCVLILLCCASGARAEGWPWSEDAVKSPAFCRGFAMGGLASYQAEGDSRVQLWRAWNYLIRSGGKVAASEDAEFRSGHGQFANVADGAAAQALLEQARSDCGLYRSGRQVTGW